MKIQLLAEVDTEKDTYYDDMKQLKAMLNVDSYKSIIWDLRNDVFREKLWGYFCDQKNYTEEQSKAAFEIMEHYSAMFYEKLTEEKISADE